VTDATTSARAEWLSHRADTYCIRGPREITGADLVRIARTLAAEPWRFTQTAPAAADDPAGIVLDNGRRRVRLEVATAAPGCVFMVRAMGGSGRCGLGDLAPLCCRMFPADPRSTTPEPADEPPRAGPTAGPTAAELAELRRAWAADRAHWHETVRRWNRAEGRSGDDPLDAEDFQRYLLEAEFARESGADWPEEVTA
jgi:hypothetical protein